jgi:3-hydroxyisobutyrate dehydrogenase-like beta-hydroxyacid dehydrogenase
MGGLMTVGVLHPGQMGVAIAASARAGGHDVLWCTEGRSAATKARAERADLRPLSSLAAVVDAAEVLVSVCPPGGAVDVARSVAAEGFSGTYVDANAVAPATAAQISEVVTSSEASYVDGGIIGGPSHPRLFLSGLGAPEVAALFLSAAPVSAEVIDGGGDFAASGLKMSYAAWSKGSTALLLAVVASARHLGIAGALRDEWSRSQPDLAARLTASTRGAPKAWRWEAEMREIARTFSDCGLPGGFHAAAADVFGRLAGLKDSTADLDQLLALLSTGPGGEGSTRRSS